MRLDRMWKLAGNYDRITELSEAGYGPNTISGIFKDNGINISADHIQMVLESADALTSKGLSKAACRELIRSQSFVQIKFA